jgi:protoporphyrinogen oxidase
VLTGAPAVRLLHENGRVAGVRYGGAAPGVITADHYISTIPITVLARSAQPAPPADVLNAISALQHVSIIFVYLKVDKPQVSPDSWMYLPEHHLTVHRISEFKNFSPDCAPPGRTMVCAEITCRIGDEHWRASEQELIDTAVSDLESIGLLKRSEVLDGAFVKRIPHAYPVYDLHYKEHLAPVLEYVHGFENLQTGGRQGLFRYNNMDQSIEMGRRMAWSVLRGADAGHEAVAAGQEYFG